MYVIFSISLWSIDDEPITAGPFIEVRTEPRYQQPAVLMVKNPNESESLLASQYESNPQYWLVAETPYTQMKVEMRTVCTPLISKRKK